MVHIYTFCDKTLVGKRENKSASKLCEDLFKMNFLIDESCIYPYNYDYSSLNFKNKDIYFLLMQKTNAKLNNAIVDLLNDKLVVNETLKKVVNDYYIRKNVPLDKNAEIEWLVPSCAVPITNPNGITQGYLVKIAESTIFVLPNNFDEFNTIYNDCLLNYLEENFSIEYKSETFKTFGLSEELLFNALKENIKNKDKVSISIFSRGLDNDIVIKAKQNNDKFNLYRQTIFDKLENYIYAVQSISMDKYLESLISSSNTHIAFVGDISINNIIDNFDINVINNNICSYVELPNQSSKIRYGIDQSQISEFGEQSAEVCYSLAVKALEQNENCDLVISCLIKFENNFGVAYIAIGNKLKIDIYKNQFYGTKKEIIDNISQATKFYLIKKLKARDFKTI